MSELEEHLFCECDECIREYRGPLSNEMRPYYLKSEADKVIAENDAEIAQLQAMLEERNSQIAKLTQSLEQVKRAARTLRKKMNHWERKFCEAMAKMCKAKYDEEDARVNGRGASWDYTSEEMKYWERWHRRWLELADEFKEVK